MLFLLALPVIAAVAAMHRYVQAYTPSNLVVRRIRAQEPQWSVAALLGVLATLLIVTMHLVGEAVETGAPGWLNMVVLVLAWDAIKFGVLSCVVTVRRGLVLARRDRTCGRGSNSTGADSGRGGPE